MPEGQTPSGHWHMAGNVFEYVSDAMRIRLYQSFGGEWSYVKTFNYSEARGGSYLRDAAALQVTERQPHGQSDYTQFGVRCAR
jgi:hypothetical protein